MAFSQLVSKIFFGKNGSDVAASDVDPLPIQDQKQTGTWGYTSGVVGTATIPANAKIIQISAVSTSTVQSSFSINSGATITIPAGQSFTFEPKGNLISPTVIFTATASYVIEFVV